MAGSRRLGDLAVGSLLLVGLLLVGARVLVFDLRTLAVDGMVPGLTRGDLLVVNRRAAPSPGDVVVHALGEDDDRYVKRVVAVEGEVVEITDGVLRVDGEALATAGLRSVEACVDGRAAVVEVRPEGRDARRWLAAPGGPDQAALRLGPGELYVLGDHRGRSKDARTWGPIQQTEVRGVVVGHLARGSCEAAPSD